MAQNNPDQEPSIEEILASIRQIISDDDAPAAAAAPEPAPAPKKKAAPPPPPPPEPEEEEEDDDVLELTDRVDDEPEVRPQIDLREADEDEDDDDESLFTSSAESAALQGFTKLASKASLDRRGTGDTTIEDIVREMMKPMLREWLDIHLPPLIEKVVQKELRKVAQRAIDDE